MRSSKANRPVRLVGLVLAGGLLAFFWWRVDPAALWATLANVQTAPLVLALALFVPQIAVSALRWHLIAGCGLATAARAVLIANALNLVVPGKLGEFAKAATTRRGVRFGAGLVMGERAADVAVVAVLGGILGILDYPLVSYKLCAGVLGATAGAGLVAAFLAVRVSVFAERTGGFGALAAQILKPAPLAATAVLWLLHGTQVALFGVAAGGSQSFALYFVLAQWTFLGSAIPLAPWGLGSRESVMFLLLSPIDRPGVIGATAVLFLLRYWIPGLLGLPVLAVWGLRSTPSVHGVEPTKSAVADAGVREAGRSPVRTAA